jgi:hypothetical protein
MSYLAVPHKEPSGIRCTRAESSVDRKGLQVNIHEPGYKCRNMQSSNPW